MSAQMAPVTVAFNNQVSAVEAAKYLGCSYSHLINLIHRKKIKAQRIERKWFVETGDLEHAKATRLISRPRSPVRVIKTAAEPLSVVKSAGTSDSVDIKLSLPRDKFELIKLACDSSGKTFLGLINEKLDGVYEQVKEKLSTVSL